MFYQYIYSPALHQSSGIGSTFFKMWICRVTSNFTDRLPECGSAPVNKPLYLKPLNLSGAFHSACENISITWWIFAAFLPLTACCERHQTNSITSDSRQVESASSPLLLLGVSANLRLVNQNTARHSVSGWSSGGSTVCLSRCVERGSGGGFLWDAFLFSPRKTSTDKRGKAFLTFVCG